MLKKTDDPALDWALRAYGVVTVLATVLVVVWADLPVKYSTAQTIWISLLIGTISGVLVGCLVFIAVELWPAQEQREIQEQERDVRRRADIARELGPHYASIVETTLAAVRHDIRESEAASAGLLGDIDFDADIRGITDNLRKAHGLQNVAATLAALDKPTAEDHKILAEAKATVAKLETAALNRAQLIAKCATEAQLVDKSLHDERQDAKASAQRAELHAKLAAMLYGIEATPDTTPTDSAADGVLLRVQAYRDIKTQIRLIRD
jgi:hypothetical protein